MAITKQEVTSFACHELEADTVRQATKEYEELINKHMSDPRSKFVDGQQLYMLPVQYGLKKINNSFVVDITFVGATNSVKSKKQV